jgi:PAS domain S-box-containing protein
MSAQIAKSDEQKKAEAQVEAFAKALGPFVVAAQATRMPMVFTDARVSGNPIIFANDAFLALTGYDRADVLGHSFDFLIERGVDPEALAEVKAAFKTSPDVDPEIRYLRKNGSEFWASLLVSPVRDRSGAVVQHFVSLVDLTRHKERQRHARMLIDELNHRVKNTLSTVQSIVGQSLRSGADPKTIRQSIDARIFALARSHDLLTQEEWESAGLLDVVNAALKPFVAHGRADRVVVSGENIHIRPALVLALSITLHELATNAVKHGSLSNDSGRILMGWEIVAAPDGDRLKLHWRETGGPPVATPSHSGFGSKVILSGLALQLGGVVALAFPVEGAVCTIDIPAPTIAAHAR